MKSLLHLLGLFTFLLTVYVSQAQAQESQGAYIAYAHAGEPSVPSYSPPEAFNLLGGVTITRNGVGNYDVQFSELGAVMARRGTAVGPSPEAGAGGHVQVTSANGVPNDDCKVGNWFNTSPLLGGPSHLMVNVRCFDEAGNPADMEFNVMFLEPNVDPGPMGLAYVDAATSSKDLTGSYAFNGAGGNVSVTYHTTGRYTVTFENMARYADPDVPGGGGLVHVTAQGTDAAHCQLTGWDDTPTGDFAADVACFDVAGALTNSRFTLLSLWPGTEAGDLAYVLADDLTNTDPYLPDVAYNNGQSSPNIVVQRSSAGIYRVTVPLFADGRYFPLLQVTERGAASTDCRATPRNPYDADLTVDVFCFGDDGSLRDAAFALSAHYGAAPDPGDTDITIDFSDYVPGTLLTNQLLETHGVRFPNGLLILGCVADAADCPRARSPRSVAQAPSFEFSREEVDMRFPEGQTEVAVSLNGAFVQDGTSREVTMIARSRWNVELDRATGIVHSDPRWTTRLRVERTEDYDIWRVVIQANEPGESTPDNQIVIDNLYFDNTTPVSDVSDPVINYPDFEPGDVFEDARFQTRVVVEDYTLEEVTMSITRRDDGSVVPGSDLVLCSPTTTICPRNVSTEVSALLPEQGEYLLTVNASDAFGNSNTLSEPFFYLPPPPVFVHKVEFNQSVTNRLYDRNIFPPEDVFIIPGKDLLVRYYLHSEGAPRANYSAVMHVEIQKADGSIISRAIEPNAGMADVDLVPLPEDTGTNRRDELVTMRAHLDRTLNFVIPGDWFDDATFTEIGLWDGVENLSRAQIYDSGANRSVLAYQVVYVNDLQYLGWGRDRFDDAVRPYLEHALPFSEVQILSERGFDYNGTVQLGLSGPCHQLMYSLSLYGDDFGPTGLPDGARVWWSKAILAEGSSLFGSSCVGIGQTPGRNFMARLSGGSVAHETGHNTGLEHASNAHGEAGGGGFMAWPYYHGAIGNPDGTFGAILDPTQPPTPDDPGAWEVTLVDPCPTNDLAKRFAPGGCALMDDASHTRVPHELMSYGTGQSLDASPIPNTRGRWPSYDTYTYFYNRGMPRAAMPLARMLAAQGDAVVPTINKTAVAPAQVLIVTGVVTPDGTPYVLPMTGRTASLEEMANQQPGDYLVELVGEDGRTLASTSVAASELADSGTYLTFIQALLPYVQGVQAVRITKTGTLIVEQTASPNAPNVEVLAPNGAEHFQGDTFEIEWEGSDMDGDLLTYIVEYSPDNGETWNTIRVVMPGQPTQFEVPRTGLTEGVRGRIRVTASDGINVSRDISNGYFSVGLEPPITSYDIYTVDASTGNTTRVTFLDETGEFNPDWSPDGTTLVHDVVTFDADGAFISQDLYLTDLATSVSTPLPGGEGGNDAAWHPDGSEILFDRCPLGTAPPACEAALYRIPATGGTPTRVRTDASDGDWGHTGQLIVFHQPSDGSIRTRHLVSGREELVVGNGTHPVWSPDDKYIAYVSGDDVYRIRVNGSGKPIGVPEQLTVAAALDGQPSWHPDGKALAFHSNRTGDFDVYTVPLGGAPVVLAGQGGTGDYDPAWSSDGGLVAYAGFTLPTSAKTSTTPRQEATSPVLEATSAETQSSADVAVTAEAYPNPFNPTTTLRFHLPEASVVRLAVYDLLGRRVVTLIDGPMEAGEHAARFDASSLPSGTYLYRLQAGSEVVTRHVALIR